jgi:hypothetical protein
MFPDARNSLRRWSESAQTKIPIPVAITLHNYFVPPPTTGTIPSERSASLKTTNDDDNDDNTETSSPSPSKDEEVAYRSRGMWLHRQTQHSSTLLPRLNLEITATIAQQQTDEEEEKEKDNKTEASVVQVVVYSQKTPQTRSVHPSWEHLDERIFIPAYRKNCDKGISDECSAHWWDDNELYKSMKVKLCILPHDDEENGKKSPSHTVISSNDVQKKKQEEIICDDTNFLETFLHPSLLERIDLGPNNDSNSNEGDLDDYLTKLPPALPPNAMLVHFSDGSIRCPSNIYEILWDNYGTHGILEPPPVEDFSRFEDDVFNTLDHAKQTPQRSRARSVSSLLDTDYNDHRNDRHNDGEDDSIPRQLLQNEELSTSLQQEQEHSTTPPRRPPTIRRVFNKEITKQIHPQTQQINVAYSCSEQDILKEDRIKEKQNLLRLIAEEERALKEDCDSLQYEQKTMLNLMKEVQVVERDICRVKIELNKQSLKWEREEFLKGAQSIKLFRDLRDIYPITLDSVAAQSSSFNNSLNTSTTTGTGGKGYLIRGLCLPVDIYTTGILEEEVNASLGYCAHLIFMVAKYLTIQLRHRIFCNGSRSAIELDGVGVFPLFLGRLAARALEREQVDRGARLLGTNVDCILMHLNLLPSSSSSLQQYHILARLQIILNFVAEGNSGGISHSDSLPI